MSCKAQILEHDGSPPFYLKGGRWRYTAVNAPLHISEISIILMSAGKCQILVSNKISCNIIMSSLKGIKPISKVYPGVLTSLMEKKDYKPRHTKSEKETVKKIFNISKDEESIPSLAMHFLSPRDHGTFEITIVDVQLTESSLKYIRLQLGDYVELRVGWKFLDFEKSMTPPEPCNDVKVSFDTLFNYKVYITEELIDYLKRRKITFEICVSNKEKQLSLGKGRTTFTNVLQNPELKSKVRVELYDYYKARQAGEKPKPSARLDTLFKINGDLDFINKLIKQAPTGSEAGPNVANIHSFFELASEESKPQEGGEKISSTVMPTESEINNFEEALDLVLTRNKALRTTQSEISTELKDRTLWLREEANWRRTLQEHAILSGKDPNEIKWRQWRDDFTSNVIIRKYVDFPPFYKPVLTITVVKMVLFDDSPPMTNEAMTQFYIEYSFLGHEGPHMETPESLPKVSETEAFQFNFRKRFSIDLRQNSEQCSDLAQFIKEGKKLTFCIISEPEVDETVPIQTCELVGYTEVSMFDVAQLEANSAAYWFDIVNCHDVDQVIGYLKIQIDGIQAMRRCALKVLAPPDYTIIQ